MKLQMERIRDKCRRRLARDPLKFIDQFTRAVIKAQEFPPAAQSMSNSGSASGGNRMGLFGEHSPEYFHPDTALLRLGEAADPALNLVLTGAGYHSWTGMRFARHLA
jgi:hypothetical protein